MTAKLEGATARWPQIQLSLQGFGYFARRAAAFDYLFYNHDFQEVKPFVKRIHVGFIEIELKVVKESGLQQLEGIILW